MRTHLKFLFTAAAATVALAGPAHAADKAYMKIKSQDGGIKGEVVQSGREGTIALKSFAWGYSTSASLGRNLNDLTVVKRVDSTSPRIFSLWGNNLPAAVEIDIWRPSTLTNTLSTASTEVLVHRYCFRNAYVSSSQTSFADGEEADEKVTFRYQSVWEMHPSGGIFYGWNLGEFATPSASLTCS